MKTIYQALGLSMALLGGAILMSSCQKQGAKQALRQELNASRRITFSLTLPGKAPITYAKLHDSFEYNIKNIRLFIFKADGSLVSTEDVSGNIVPEGSPNGDRYTLTKTFKNEKGVYRFAFVANEEIGALANVQSLSDLQTRLATQVQAANAKCEQLIYNGAIPITGISEKVAIDNHNNVEVPLTRIVARIDVVNNTPDLAISEIRLNNSNSRSYLFAKSDYAAPISASRVSGILPYTALNTPLSYVQGNVEQSSLKKAFYLYEGIQPNKNADDVTQVELIGTLGNEHTVHYYIPFIKDGKAVSVKRNNLYTIVIGDGQEVNPNSKTINFDIVVSDWKQYTFNQHFSILSLSSVAGDGSLDDYSAVLSYGAAAGSNTLAIRHKTGNTDSYKVGVEKAAEAWLHASIAGTQVSVNVDANSSGAERSGKLRIQSTTDADASYVLVVKQSK